MAGGTFRIDAQSLRIRQYGGGTPSGPVEELVAAAGARPQLETGRSPQSGRLPLLHGSWNQKYALFYLAYTNHTHLYRYHYSIHQNPLNSVNNKYILCYNMI